MSAPTLDLTSFEDASKAFSNVLNLALKIEKQDPGEREFYLYEALRSAVIQHFEFCYELSWKFMQRWLEIYNGDDVEGLGKRALFRLAKEKGLISDFDKWVEFMGARNETSHTYGEEIADKVYAIAKESKVYIDELLLNLISKLEAEI